MNDTQQLAADIRHLAISIAGLELALWATLRAVLLADERAAAALEEIAPALLNGVSGGDGQPVRARAEMHLGRWRG